MTISPSAFGPTRHRSVSQTVITPWAATSDRPSGVKVSAVTAAGGGVCRGQGRRCDVVVCPWIPHDKGFTRDLTLKTAEAFNKISTAAEVEGLRFGYHCHGYEFVPSPEGTLFETLAGATDPKRVMFQVDVFHAYHGGTDPARLIARYSGRVVSLHLKDLKKGAEVKAGAATASADVDVPVGTGQIDMPAVLRAAMKAGTSIYYLEDESSTPWENIPQSLAFLKSFK